MNERLLNPFKLILKKKRFDPHSAYLPVKGFVTNITFNPRNHFTFFAAESDILGVENDKKSEVLFIQFLCFMKGKLKINGFF